MTPFFTPTSIGADIPIVTAGVNPAMCQVAGAVADGFQVHPFHSPAYLRDVIRPAIDRGRARAGRVNKPFNVGTSVFTVTGESEHARARAREETKRTIAFYASTPSYRGVLAHHGWDDVGKRLSRLASRGAWDAMAQEITDEMLNTFAVVAPLPELGVEIRSRYAGLVNHIGLYTPFSSVTESHLEALIAAMHT
jgi:probable F420-dependent oxidoreductase